MSIWASIVKILLWPGSRAVVLFPNLGDDETRLVHNIVNYVVWLAIFCGLLIYVLIKTMPPA